MAVPTPPPTKPPRDILGFFRAVIEFFTGLTGLLTAAVGIVATIIAFSLSQSSSQPAGTAPPVPNPTPVVTDDPVTPEEPKESTSTAPLAIRAGSVEAMSDACSQAVQDGAAAAQGLGPTGDPGTDIATADRRAASRLRRIDVPDAHRQDLEEAAGSLERAAVVVEVQGLNGLAAANVHEQEAIVRLRSMGATGC